MINFIKCLYIFDSLIRDILGIPIITLVNTSVAKLTAANAVTWTVSDSGVSNGTGGNRTRLTTVAAADHGLTTGSQTYGLYQTNAPANWPALGTIHTIATRNSTTVIDLDTAYVSGMDVPTFAGIATKIPILALTVPALKSNSKYLFDCLLRSVASGGTANKIYCTLGAVDITTVTFDASINRSLPIRAGFRNMNNVSEQLGVYGKSSSGSGGGSDPVAHTLDTSTGSQIYTVSLEVGTVDKGIEMSGYSVRIEN